MLLKGYGELIVNVYMLKDLNIRNVNEETGKFINYVMKNDEYLSKCHLGSDKFKGYSFSTPYPIEKDKVYKQNEIYRIMIRSYDFEFLNRMKKSIDGLGNDVFQHIGSELKRYSNRNIKEIITITPAICSVKVNGKTTSWIKENKNYNIEDIIFNNIMHKYNYINKTSFNFITNDIFEKVTIENNIAITINYKGIKMLGYKYRIKFRDNGFAQEIANFATVLGILEKNSSLGCGFVKAFYE